MIQRAEVRGIGVGKMLDVEDVARDLGADFLPPPELHQAFRDQRIMVVCPTRGKIDERITAAWKDLIWPAYNAERKWKFARGYEVGTAYDAFVASFLASDYADWPYIVTLEDDNLIPRDGLVRLLETMEAGAPDGGKWAGVSGLYRTKDPLRTPLALGDVEEFRRTGKRDYRAVDLSKLPKDQRVVEVLGIPMGCAIWRTEVFRAVSRPWYRTISDSVRVGGDHVPVAEFERLWAQGKIDRSRSYTRAPITQDVFFCDKAGKLGFRFAVDLSCDVGHLDTKTGMVY